jgi:hypothetical protein
MSDPILTFDGCPNITIDGSALVKQYQSHPLTRNDAGYLANLWATRVLRQLNIIGHFAAGRAVFSEIHFAGHDLRIVPYDKEDTKKYGWANAYAHMDDGFAASPEGVFIYAGGSDNPQTPWDERYQAVPGLGTGGGSDVHLHYTPDRFMGDLAPVQIGYGPDEVLLHEMIHAMRDMQGLRNPLPTEGSDRAYDNIEEFLAVLVTNIYMAQKNPSAVLRLGHHGNDFLPNEECTSQGFLTNNNNNLLYVQNLGGEEHIFFGIVAEWPGDAFNPLREYMTNQNHYDDLVKTF